MNISSESVWDVIHRKGWRDLSEEEQIWLNLCAAIIEFAIDEWRELDYGRYLRRRMNAQMVYAMELEAFFNSPYFETLLTFVLPGISPEAVRERLRITKGDQDARQASLSTEQKNIERRHLALCPDFRRKGGERKCREPQTSVDGSKAAGGKRETADHLRDEGGR